MKRAWGSLCVVAALASAAVAQTPAQDDPVTARWLERRVAEQLATDGIALSRRGVMLEIEPAGAGWRISLVDVTTGWIAASSEVGALPGDREAAVSAMTRAVAELAAQIAGPAGPPASPAPAAPADAELGRARREIAELQFKHRAIRFEPSDPATPPTRLPDWLFLRGELDEPLDATAFYHLIGRDDLAWSYRRRRALGIGSYVVAGTSLVVAGVLFAGDDTPFCEPELTPDGHGACQRIHRPSSTAAAATMLGIGVTGVVIGLYFSVRAQPIGEDDARALADAYNQRLRRRLGLPPAPRRALLRDVTLSPYAAGRAAGAVLGARF